MQEKSKVLTISLPETLLEQIVLRSQERKMTVSGYLRLLMKEIIDGAEEEI